ncbi:MAG: ImmA/IrrE family metallo-endopeptidase [Thermomicrobiales bacterium]
MTTRVEVAPAMLAWARERSGKRDAIQNSFPKLHDWEAGTAQPTFRQLEDYARATYTPLGYFFLPDPPEIPLPIPDMRTVGSTPLSDPSPNLLDTIVLCMERQDWFRAHLLEQGADPLTFVGSLNQQMPVAKAADRIRSALDFEVATRAKAKTWEDALRLLIGNAEAIGILVMISGIVGSNTHRPLDPDEFRGFALADDYAPVIFINGADAKSAQNFTLVHELVHIWLGSSALTGGAEFPHATRSNAATRQRKSGSTRSLRNSSFRPPTSMTSSTHRSTLSRRHVALGAVSRSAPRSSSGAFAKHAELRGRPVPRASSRSVPRRLVASLLAGTSTTPLPPAPVASSPEQ